MRLLITGATGFAGRHLTSYCAEQGHEVHALVRPGREGAVVPRATAHAADLRDGPALARLVEGLAPDAVAHLAGRVLGGLAPSPTRSAPGRSTSAAPWRCSRRCARRRPRRARWWSRAGRSTAACRWRTCRWGPTRPCGRCRRTAPPRRAADLAAGQYRAAYGLPALRVRAFNHVGPGQDPRFVLPNVARQIAQAEHDGRDAVEVRVGNVDTRRDFTDVRDMVRAYLLVIERGDPDAVYLACSGRSRPVRELIEGLAALARIPVTFASDAGLRRAGEQPDLYGSPARLRDDTGWTPEIPIETTLADTLDWWRERVVDEDRE